MSNDLKSNFTCPECRTPIQCNAINITTVEIINSSVSASASSTTNKNSDADADANMNTPVSNMSTIEKKLGVDWKNKCINKYGSKMMVLVQYLYTIFENKENRVIIFSQYDKMLRLIGKTLEEFSIKFVYCCGNNYVLNRNINKFKIDNSYRVIMMSSENSNSGSNLTEANYILMCDVLFDDVDKVKAMESQAIGRAVRLGQKLGVKVVRFITKGTVEEEHFNKTRYDMNTLQE
jgi:SNF2 family DNA or RNA helicase